MMPAAARPPKAPPIVKPQNIMVTRNERLRSRLYSEVRVIAIGMAPPRPRPVTKRQNASDSTPVAQAERMLATPKPKVEKMRTDRRGRSRRAAHDRVRSAAVPLHGEH